MEKIKLGRLVRDKVTGFEGIAVARTTYLQGCDRIELQPKVGKDGKLDEPQAFDEPVLETIGAGILPEEAEPPGGPHRGHGLSRPIIKHRR